MRGAAAAGVDTAELEVGELGFDKPSLELMPTPSYILPAGQGSHAFIA